MKSGISVATGRGTVYVRVQGQGNMNNALAFKEFADRMLDEGFDRFVIDLAACDGMDSTFMGTLLGIALGAMQAVPPGTAQAGLLVLNASPKNRGLMENLGLATVVTLAEKPMQMPVEGLSDIPTQCRDSRERLEHIMAVHQQLVAFDKRNEACFGPFLAQLNREYFGN